MFGWARRLQEDKRLRVSFQRKGNSINRLLRDRTWESFAAMCAYPKIMVRWDQAREVRRRVHAFSDGAWLDLWKATGAGTRSNPRRGRKRPADEDTESAPSRVQDRGFLNSLQGMMEDGAFGKAAKHLLSAGLHDPTDPAVLEALRRLHPPPAPMSAQSPRDLGRHGPRPATDTNSAWAS